jgi:hypothetical protein
MSALHFRSVLLAAAVIAATLGGCASSTTVSTVWKSPDAAPTQFTKVLAVVLNTSPAERRAGEDELVQSITSAHAVASYTLISDSDIKDKNKIRAVIKEQGFDGAAVIRLVSSQQQTTYVPPRYDPSHDPFDYGTDLAAANNQPGYTTTDTFFAAEISLYSTANEKLIWAGSSTTENPSNIQDLIAQVARAAAAELRRQGLIK